MTHLTLIGYWRSKEAPMWPDPAEFVDHAWDEKERRLVGVYLSSGQVPWVAAGFSRCRLCDKPNGCAENTDGTYIWPEGLAHYIIDHDVRLPQIVVDHILNNQLREYSVESVEVDYDWWKSITPKMSQLTPEQTAYLVKRRSQAIRGAIFLTIIIAIVYVLLAQFIGVFGFIVFAAIIAFVWWAVLRKDAYKHKLPQEITTQKSIAPSVQETPVIPVDAPIDTYTGEYVMDPISFNATGWFEQPKAQPPRLRVWHNQSRDGIGLYYFNIPPSIPAPLEDIDRLRHHQRLEFGNTAGLIELNVILLDGVPAFRQIIKIPQTPTGITYLGGYTIPRRDFSFALRIQCQEYGTTGIREAFVMARLLETGQLSLSQVKADGAASMNETNWASDPYDPSFKGAILRNLAEDEQYDALFPDHPLSRLRHYINQLEPTIRIADEVKKSAPL